MTERVVTPPPLPADPPPPELPPEPPPVPPAEPPAAPAAPPAARAIAGDTSRITGIAKLEVTKATIASRENEPVKEPRILVSCFLSCRGEDRRPEWFVAFFRLARGRVP